MRQEKRQTLFNCKLAGFSHHDGPLAWGEMKIGSKLDVEAEDNAHDPNAIALYFGDYKLGYIPRDKNETLRVFIEMGWEEAIDVRISRMSPDEHPEHQVDISVGVIRKKMKK